MNQTPRIHITHLLLLLSLALLLPPVSAGYVISEFCADGYAPGDGDEYFILDGTGNLSEWHVTDGEGTISFPQGSGRVIVARSAAAYYEVHGTYPDFELINSLSPIPDATVSGKFQMANTQDSLTLLHNGIVIQTVSWPDMVKCGEGKVHTFKDGVWDSRIMKIGQTTLTPASYSADKVVLFVSPDCSYQTLTAIISSAQTSINISMYEFTHPGLASALSSALNRGVSVRILMCGSPVGGIPEEEKCILDYLTNAGAEVYMLAGTTDYPARYRFVHTKYLIADAYVTVIISENFKESGIPYPGKKGNRGWGAAVYDTEFAAYVSAVFTADICGRDITRYPAGTRSLPSPLTADEHTPLFEPHTITDAVVTPVFAPDTSYLIPELLSNAQTSIIIQQAYITKYPDIDENPWLTLATKAATRGADVRVQLDGMYYNTQEDEDNDELAAEINRLGLPNLQAKLLTGREGISKIHNKGVITDGRYVLISSINWNYNSPNANRESGLIIESPEAAAYYTKIFDYDWEEYVLDNPASYSLGFDVRYLIAGLIITGGIVFIIIRRRK